MVNIYHELTKNNGHQDNFNKLNGNIPELKKLIQIIQNIHFYSFTILVL